MSFRRFSLPFGAQTLYSLRAVFVDLYQRKFATLITVLVIAVSLTIPTVSYLLWKNIHHATTQFYPESELTVYLHKNLSVERESRHPARREIIKIWKKKFLIKISKLTFLIQLTEMMTLMKF